MRVAISPWLPIALGLINKEERHGGVEEHVARATVIRTNWSPYFPTTGICSVAFSILDDSIVHDDADILSSIHSLRRRLQSRAMAQLNMGRRHSTHETRRRQHGVHQHFLMVPSRAPIGRIHFRHSRQDHGFAWEQRYHGRFGHLNSFSSTVDESCVS